MGLAPYAVLAKIAGATSKKSGRSAAERSMRTLEAHSKRIAFSAKHLISHCPVAPPPGFFCFGGERCLNHADPHRGHAQHASLIANGSCDRERMDFKVKSVWGTRKRDHDQSATAGSFAASKGCTGRP